MQRLTPAPPPAPPAQTVASLPRYLKNSLPMLFFRLLPLVAAVGFVAGCQSTRLSYSFPAAPRAVALASPAAPAAPAVGAATFSQKLPAVAAPRHPAPTPTGTAAAVPRPRLARLPLRPRPAPVARPVAAARHLSFKPQAPAEVGLGTTVLGVLGLVALPIALLGLLLSGGGLVWGIVAGAAAVAVLVAKLDPFG